MSQNQTVLHLLDRLQVVSYVTARDLADHQDAAAAGEAEADAAVDADDVAAVDADAVAEAENPAAKTHHINAEITTKITELRGNLDEAISKVLTWWSKPPPLLLDLYR